MNTLKIKLNDCVDEQISSKIQNMLKTTKDRPLPPGYEHELHYKLVKTAYEASQSAPNFAFQLLHFYLYPHLRYAFCGLLFLLIPSFLLYQHKNKVQTIEYSSASTMCINQVGIFKFRINSPKKVDYATLQVELSDGIGFVKNGQLDANQKEIKWCGGLDEGENVIAIYIVGTKRGNWHINARMVENSTVKKVKVPLTVV